MALDDAPALPDTSTPAADAASAAAAQVVDTALAAVDPGGSPKLPEPDDVEPAMDVAAIAAALKKGREEPPAAAPAPPDAPPATPVAIQPPKAPEGLTDDAKADKAMMLFERVARMERERAAEQTELARLRAEAEGAARSGQLTPAQAAAFRANPEAFFGAVAWDQQTILDYLQHGQQGVRPQAAAQRTEADSIKAELAQIKASLADRDARGQYDAYVASIPGQLTAESKNTPLSAAFYADEPGEHVSAIVATVRAAQQSGVQLSVADAARAIEGELVKHAKRLERTRSQSTAAAATSTQKPVSPTLTNALTPAARAPAAEPDETQDGMDAAVAVLQAARNRARPAAQSAAR